MQTLVTVVIVVGCAGYVLWRLLLPAAARRRILNALGREAASPQGCGCEGCDRAAAPPKQVVQWMPRRQRD